MSMTENRCIEVLKKMKHMFTETCAKIDENTALDMAVEAIEEIQQYKAIGTADEFKAIKQWKADITEFFSKYNVNSVLQMTKRFSELTEKEDLCDRNIKMFNDIACDIAKKVRAKAIDEFAEAIMVKATEESEKVVFDGRLVGDALSLDCVSDMVLEIALDMKGEKE